MAMVRLTDNLYIPILEGNEEPDPEGDNVRVVEAMCGTDVETAIKEALGLAHMQGKPIVWKHNGVRMRVEVKEGQTEDDVIRSQLDFYESESNRISDEYWTPARRATRFLEDTARKAKDIARRVMSQAVLEEFAATDQTTWSDRDRNNYVRAAVNLIEVSDVDVLPDILARFKDVNFVPGQWVDDPDFKNAPTVAKTTQWYAGQIMDIIESNSLFAMNSIINCLDKFAPKLQ